jgi:hypothetical protein
MNTDLEATPKPGKQELSVVGPDILPQGRERMKKVFAVMSLLVVTGVFSGFAWAGDISNASINKLMALSGLNKQIAEMPAAVQAAIAQEKQRNPSLPDARLREVQRAIEKGFQPSVILNSIKAQLKNDLSERDAKYLLSWYQSDLGKRITRAEEAASTGESLREMMTNSQRYLADRDRVWMAKRLDFLMGGTDKMVRMQMDTSLAVFSSLSTALNPGQPVNIKAFKAQLSSQEPQIRASAEQFMVLSLVYSYKDVDLASLEKYADFLQQPITSRFNECVFKGLDNGFQQGVGEMTKYLKTMLIKRQSRAI